MNLLIIDDEAYVIDSIIQNVNWQETGISHAYTASTLEQAEELMRNVPIQLLVCDIVMPGHSGFEVVEELKAQGYEFLVLFLTSYAEFEYAKRAISLNSFDYLLKPVDFAALTEAIKKAKEKAEAMQGYKNYQAEWKNRKNKERILKEKFWKELLESPEEGRSVETVMEKYQPDVDMQAEYALILLGLFYDPQFDRQLEEKTMRFVLGNVAGEMFAEYAIDVEGVLGMEKDTYLLIIRRSGEDANEQRCAGERPAEAFTGWLRKTFSFHSWCGVGIWDAIEGLAKSLERLKMMRDDSLSVRDRVIYERGFVKPDRPAPHTDLYRWELLLENHRQEELLESIRGYLKRLDHQELITRDLLKTFRMDLTQLIYTCLSRKGIQAHLLFSGSEEEHYFRGALESTARAQEYAEYLVRTAMEYETFIRHGDSVSRRIRQYIDEHFREEIHRNDLAKLVYLNTDYISRIFKKEEGLSISAYIMQKRVDEAKRLLGESSLPVNAISLHVGYSNFSYFTKMFRENTGYSPLEYRRIHREKEKEQKR